ncbi:imelysin family protein [Marinoscillum sp.]|uniref:imelysin family protein n=1 Tax=Marinoscillum sp. TaxID=2024838 RepID=UPI003BAD96EF
MRLLTVLFLALAMLSSCVSDKDPFGKMNDFDQGPMLENLANNLILPSYLNLRDKTKSLREAVSDYRLAPTIESLMASREALKSARLAWQECSPYQFGPSESNGLAGILNIYPVDTLKINRNIESSEYNLTTLANADARGFQSLGYLLYRPGLSDQELISSALQSDRLYADEVALLMEEVSSAVYDQWSSQGGNYLGTFTSEDSYGVNVGSSVGKLINAMNLDFERNTRDGKIGIPVGIRSLGEPIPHACEAYYAGYSAELFSASIATYYTLYKGADDVGLDDYLQAIEATTTQNEDLSVRIDTQFKALINAGNMLEDPLPEQILNDQVTVQTVFAEMQRLAVLFKTDMASSLGVVITYQDNDGD